MIYTISVTKLAILYVLCVIVETWPSKAPLGPMCILDAPPADREDDDHSNVIPVLPVQSRDHSLTGRTLRRRRREAAAEDDSSRGQRLPGQRSVGQRSPGENVVMRGADERRTAAAAAITVSQYVTGQYVNQSNHRSIHRSVAYIYIAVTNVCYRQHCAQRKAPVFELLRGRFGGFSHRGGDTLHRWGEI